ncbi:hypothetical protein [Solirubrum puertoriconensis]|uniref:Uncharacterized protein n=1 Tax=Solirubrum puertoriconensis TaxID=1751427 RepID=A0A9X0HJ21_SOLP1|nr:hypothetical protein [Solirubrum puertoriconensis]KUG06744.1 hypothetical protein ASU33_05275 [Solirubrum puertoriconensis]
MRIDELNQEHADIDWFAVDSEGHVVHVASGGGVLPESVAASEEDLLQLHQYFLTLPETEAAALVQPEANAAQSGRNAEGFVRYARRGLYSFDKTNLHEHRDTQYHLVARPAQPLRLAELPGPIAALLLRTQLPVAVPQLTRLNVAGVA